MATLLVGYDLNKTGQNFEGLIKALEEDYDTCWHDLDSTWVIVTDKSCVTVRDELKKHFDSNDELLVVVKLSGEGAWRGPKENGSKWLMDHL